MAGIDTPLSAVAAGLALVASAAAALAALAAWRAKEHLEIVTEGLEKLLAEGMAVVPLTRGATALVANLRMQRLARQHVAAPARPE